MDEYDRTAAECFRNRMDKTVADVASVFRSAAAEKDRDLAIAVDMLVMFWKLHPLDVNEDTIRAAFTPMVPAAGRTCTWTEDDDGLYRTSCGHVYFFDTGTATENKQRFCGYCGARLIEKRAEPAP